jgi:hypothetical protein
MTWLELATVALIAVYDLPLAPPAATGQVTGLR